MPPYLLLLPMIILEGGAIVGTVNVKGFSGGWDVSRAACIFSVESLDHEKNDSKQRNRK